MADNKKCLRCMGNQRIFSLSINGLERECWVCRGAGELSPPCTEELRSFVLVKKNNFDPKSGKPRLVATRIHLPFKQALNAVGKPGPWGQIPRTILHAQELFKATVLGRRATYVWKRARAQLNPHIRAYQQQDIEGTKHDPYQPELDALAAELVVLINEANQ